MDVHVGLKLRLRTGRIVFEVTDARIRPSDSVQLFDYKADNGGGCNLPAEIIAARFEQWRGYWKSARIAE